VTALGWTTVALGVVAVVCGLLVFRLDSMARVTFLLLASFVAVAADVAALGLGYLGVVIILMMTVEMVIMVVFMVMLMMNPAGLMPMTMVHNAWGARAVALVVFGVLAAGALLVPWPVAAPPAGPPPDPTAALGEALMGPQMLVMMTLGLALLGTIVGTVALSVPRGRYAEADEAGPVASDDPAGAAR
jgi:NADH-quinone oxidoreductase subunit J